MVAYSPLHPAFIPSPLSCKQIRPPAFPTASLPHPSLPSLASSLPPSYPSSTPLFLATVLVAAFRHHLLPPVVPNLASIPSIFHPQSLPSLYSLLSCYISPLSLATMPAAASRNQPSRIHPPTSLPSILLFFLLSLPSLSIPSLPSEPPPLPSLPSPLSRYLSPPPRHHAQLSPLHSAALDPSSRYLPSYFHPPALPPISPLFSLPTNPTPLPSPSPLCSLPSPATSNLSSLLSPLPPASRCYLLHPQIRLPTAHLPTSIPRLSLSFPSYRAVTSPLTLAIVPAIASHRAAVSPLPLAIVAAAASRLHTLIPLFSLPTNHRQIHPSIAGS